MWPSARREAGMQPVSSPASLLRHFLAIAAYTIVALAITWPVLRDPNAVLFGDYGDTRGWVWWIWAELSGHLQGTTSDLIAAPFGFSTEHMIRQPLSEAIVLSLARMFGIVASVNAFVVIALVCTATATYAVLYSLTVDRIAALLAGFIFGFCPAAIMQAAGGHQAYAFNAFIPLFLQALLLNARFHSPMTAAWVGASYAALTLTALYFGYFSLFIGGFICVYDFFTSRAPRAFLLGNYCICGLVAVALVVPFEIAPLWTQRSASAMSAASGGHAHALGELFAFSSRPWNFLLPSIDHPLFGHFVETFERSHLNGSNLFEQTLYLGYSPLILCAAGALALRGAGADSGRRGLFALFGAGAAFMYFMSLPPVIGGWAPTLSYFTHAVAPMFRAYARFGVLVTLFVACMVAVAVAQLRRRWPGARCDAALMGLAAMLLIEYWTVPPYYARPITEPPAVYQWLGQQKGPIIVAEYPMVRYDEAASYSYLFWQRVHQKRLVNGSTPDNPAAWAFQDQVRDLDNADTLRTLKSAGVRYVIIHKAMYDDGPIPGPIKRYYEPARAALTFAIPPFVETLFRTRCGSLRIVCRQFGTDLVVDLADFTGEGF